MQIPLRQHEPSLSPAIRTSSPQVSDELSQRAIAKMRSPYDMRVICIDITNKCDLACSNCTRLLENQDAFWEMTLENFRTAVRSLTDFRGWIGILGGNPAMHRNFKEICEIFAEEIPEKERRGLWTNNIFKHSEIAERTFGAFNLNPHGDARGVESLQGLRRLGIGNYWEGHSSHSPLLTAVRDLFPEDEMWDRISKCEINQGWSATIVQNKGKLRAYFCEVAAAFDLARGTDHGIEVTPGWWRRHISEFEHQVKHFCPGCGVPARLKGSLDVDEIDTYSKSNADLAAKSAEKKKRRIREVDTRHLEFLTHKVTAYSEGQRRAEREAEKKKRLYDLVGLIAPWLPRGLKRVLRPAAQRMNLIP
jgi:hypothetical protein